ncbi:MAG: glycoside hydrolase family 127 protein, partial [Clostridia bacterium]|nr:glycoside hydrolase family 127 protein [Clostridia bacterium]
MKSDYRKVTLTGGYWKAKEELVKTATTNAVYDRFNESGRIDAFKCDWTEESNYKPHFFWDSDVAKWMEGAAYVLSKEDRPDLEEKLEWLIDQIEKNQGEDGYFNIYFTVIEPEKRFTNRDYHELYAIGHLIEAGVAYYEATGKDKLLRIACRAADHV